MEYTPNPELEKLRAEKEKNEKEIEQINHKITRLENRQKYYEDGERKRRTHRLCTRGAMLEKFLGCPNELTDEQVEEILKIAFHPEAVGMAIEQFRESNENTTL